MDMMKIITVMSLVATVLTACGIETSSDTHEPLETLSCVATVLTACGIETVFCFIILVPFLSCNSTYRLRY